MTHEELLDRIYWHWRYVQGQDGLQAMTDYRKALLAVVELHKPSENDSWGSVVCVKCPTWEYPCPTIQTIEKELK
jgi:hypothetical protein